MLQMRKPARRLGVPAVVSLPDRLQAADPGLVRLMLAVRGTTAVVLTTIAGLIAADLLDVNPVEFATGIVLSMMGPFMMREPTRGQRQRTLLVLAFAAAVATVITGLLHDAAPVGDAFFLALVFLTFLLYARDVRVIGIGLVGVVTSYVSLYLRLPPATLPMQIAGVGVAIPLTAFACFVVVPVNPAATLRRAVRAVQWRAAHVPRSAAAGDAVALRRDLVRLSEATLVADDQLELLQPVGREAVRAGLLEIELASARLIEALKREKPDPRQATRLLLHERRMQRGRRYAMLPEQLEPGTLRAALVALGRATHGLGIAAAGMQPAREPPTAPPLPPGPLAWRLATRVTLAAGLGMAGGMALSTQRWFWAVLTVYVVFLNTRSRGDTIYKGIQRLGGTLLGIVGGLVVATLLAQHEGLQAAVLLLSVFGMYYLFLISYTAGIFCVTIMLGQIYGMLGAPLETVLQLRLEETAIGAAAAVFVAACVLPTRTRDQVMQSGRNVLAALAGAVGASRDALLGTPGAAPVAAMRRVDRQVADLRLAFAPLTVRRAIFRRSALERPVPALLDCVHWARVLADSCRAAPDTPDAAALAARATRIQRRLAALAGPPAADAAEPPVEADDAAPGPDGVAVTAALDGLEKSLCVLAERLQIGVLEGFALG
jgi:uncharacterized membrane protein YccC